MHFLQASIAALAVSVPIVQAASAIVYNKCDIDVYIWSVSTDHGAPSKPVTLAANTGKYSETYQKTSEGGVSIKISNTTSLGGAITQLEYTLGEFIWYDVSNVDCKTVDCPFQKHGMYLQAGDSCPTVSCKGGDLICSGAYTNPDDNWASLSCDTSADVALYLCQDSASGGSSSGPASSYAAPAASSTKETSSAPATSAAVYIPSTTAVVPTTLATISKQDVQIADVTTAPKPTTTAEPEVQVVTTIVYVTKTIPYASEHTHDRRAVHAHHPHQRRHV